MRHGHQMDLVTKVVCDMYWTRQDRKIKSRIRSPALIEPYPLYSLYSLLSVARSVLPYLS
jgi:hypothetical protein